MVQFIDDTSASYQSSSESETSTETKCEQHATTTISLVPYLYPLLIEYSVLAAVMCCEIWERSGHHRPLTRASSLYQAPTDTDDRVSQQSVRTSYHNNHLGFILGWIVVIITVIFIIMYLYMIYGSTTGEVTTLMQRMSFDWDSFIKILSFAFVIIGMVEMLKVGTKTNRLKKLRKQREGLPFVATHGTYNLDKFLVHFTFFCLLVFNAFSVFVASIEGRWMILVNAIISILHAGQQTLFIIKFAAERRSVTLQNRTKKPGRQCLEIIRYCNISVWAMNTFILMHPEIRLLDIHTLPTAQMWMVISSFMQPVTLLYYFHCCGCISEIIHKTYTDKYLDLLPAGEVDRESRSSASDDDDGTMKHGGGGGGSGSGGVGSGGCGDNGGDVEVMKASALPVKAAHLPAIFVTDESSVVVDNHKNLEDDDYLAMNAMNAASESDAKHGDNVHTNL